MRIWLLCILISLTLPAGAESAADLFTRAKREANPVAQIELLTQVVKKSPTHVGAYHYRADAYFALGKYPQAIKDYNRVVALRPQDPFRYYARGLAYIQMQEPTLALADFSKAISLKPNYLNFYLARARTYNTLKKYGPALADYQKHVGSWEKASADILREVIPVSIEASRWNMVRTQLDALQEDTAQWHMWNGKVLQANGRLDEAIAAYSKAVNRSPDQPQPYRLRANAFKELGDYDSALEDYTRALELVPDAYWFNRRGLAYEETKQFEQAAADYARAIELDPAWAIAYNNRGFIKLNLKDYSGAKKDFEKAISLDPSVPTPYVNLAGTYWLSKKDRKNMYKQLEKALNHNFKNFESLFDDEQKGWMFKGVNTTTEFRSFLYK